MPPYRFMILPFSDTFTTRSPTRSAGSSAWPRCRRSPSRCRPTARSAISPSRSRSSSRGRCGRRRERSPRSWSQADRRDPGRRARRRRAERLPEPLSRSAGVSARSPRASEPPAAVECRPRRRSSSTRPSIRTRRRTSAICGTPRSATRSCACCGSAARRSKCRTTSTTPASRSPTSSSASASSSACSLDDVQRDRRHDALRLLLLGSLLARHRVVRRRQEPARRFARAALHDLEHGGNETAEMGAFIVDRIVRAHLKTMARLNIGYDLLTYEGDILRLQFWAHAFEILKAQGAVFLQTEGKLAGLLGDADRGGRASRRAEREPTPRTSEVARERSSCDRTASSPTSARTSPTSSGSSGCSAATSATGGSPSRPNGRPLWSTTSGEGEPGAPPFGHAQPHLQRHRLAADVPAGAAQPGAADARPSEGGRELDPFFVRDGGAVARHGAGARLPAGRRRGREEAVRRGVGPQGARREDRRPAGSARSRRRRRKSRSAIPSSRRRSAGASARRLPSPRSATSC